MEEERKRREEEERRSKAGSGKKKNNKKGANNKNTFEEETFANEISQLEKVRLIVNAPKLVMDTLSIIISMISKIL